MDKRHLFGMLIIILMVVACGGEEVEQSSELVLPTAVVQEVVTPVTTTDLVVTLPPTAVALPNTPTPPLVEVEGVEIPPTALPPTLIPSDVVVNLGNRPFISQDLLFVGDGDLRKWSQQDGSVTTLLYHRESGRQEIQRGDVGRVVISGDGTVAVAARTIPGEWMNSELWWVNIVSGESRQLAASVRSLISMALSPDGRSLLYVESDADILGRSGTVYRLDMADGGATAVGRCASEPTAEPNTPERGICLGVHWTRDSQNMLWSDAFGIWLRHLNAPEPILIVSAATEALPFYYLGDWSLNGRYLLVTATQDTGPETLVLDLVTNSLIPLPGTKLSDDLGYVEVDWMQDGRLFIIRQKDEQGQLAPTLQLWRIADTQIVLEETTLLQLPLHRWLQDAGHFVNGRFAFTILADDPLTQGIYVMASSNEQPQRVNGLPYLAGETTWLYDTVGAILTTLGRDDAFIFLGADVGEGVVYEIRPLLGNLASNFIWLPR